MKRILAATNLGILRAFATSRGLVALDFDGTLAPIVARPQQARLRPSTLRLLLELSELYPCAVISGRSRSDVLRHLEGIRLAAVAGNHGMELEPGRERSTPRVRKWVRVLERALGALQGVSIDDKRYSIAIHYRRSRAKKATLAAIRAAVATLSGARIIQGKQIVNVLPQGAANKGTALEEIRDQSGCDTALYVGDDENDEDVFALRQPGRLLTIRVGKKLGSAAQYYLRNQHEVDALLRVLVKWRRAGKGPS